MRVKALVLHGNSALLNVIGNIIKRSERDAIFHLETREKRGVIVRVHFRIVRAVEVLGSRAVGHVAQPIRAQGTHGNNADKDQTQQHLEHAMLLFGFLGLWGFLSQGTSGGRHSEARHPRIECFTMVDWTHMLCHRPPFISKNTLYQKGGPL